MSDRERCIGAIQLTAWGLPPDSPERKAFMATVDDLLTTVEDKAARVSLYVALRHACAIEAHVRQLEQRHDADVMLDLLENIDAANLNP